MKKIWIVVIVIFFVVFLDFITENYTNKVVKQISKNLKEINKEIEEDFKDGNFLINEEEKQKIKKDGNELLKLWRKQDKILSFYIEHDEIEKVSDKINLLNKQLELYNYLDGMDTIVEVEFLLIHLSEKQTLNLKNIF